MANIYKNQKLDLTTTAATTLYTVPSNSRAIVKSLLVNDDSGSGDSISVTLTDAAAAVFSLFKRNGKSIIIPDAKSDNCFFTLPLFLNLL